MTKRELINQVFSLSNGKLNRSEMTRAEFISDCVSQLEKYRHAWFSITLPDGDWLMFVDHNPTWGWDYMIPDSREQEKAFEELYKEDMQ